MPDSEANLVQRPVLFLVEGQYDIRFLTILSCKLHCSDPQIPDLEALQTAGKLLFIPTGGNPQLWTHRLAPMGCQEIHLYDRESAAESLLRRQAAMAVNQRPNCRAFVTSKRSLENYLHPLAVEAAGGGAFEIGNFEDIGALVARDWYARSPQTIAWNDLSPRARGRFIQHAKKWLNTIAVAAMTAEWLQKQDRQGELLSLFEAVRAFCLTSR